jgi:hypothetical protein
VATVADAAQQRVIMLLSTQHAVVGMRGIQQCAVGTQALVVL